MTLTEAVIDTKSTPNNSDHKPSASYSKTNDLAINARPATHTPPAITSPISTQASPPPCKPCSYQNNHFASAAFPPTSTATMLSAANSFALCPSVQKFAQTELRLSFLLGCCIDFGSRMVAGKLQVKIAAFVME